MDFESAPPLAAIDAGSNTIHLVVARLTPDGRGLRYLADELDLTRLGEDVSATGAIGEERQARAVAIIREQAELARAKGATTILGIATEGVRAAANAQAFLVHIQRETGVALALISGDQEAALTYWGATSGLTPSDERRAVLDLGGGSLEIVIGAGPAILWRVSVPLGSGAMHSQHVPADPPVASELAAVRAVVAETLRPLDLPLPIAAALACGGTANTLAALAARTIDAMDTVPDAGEANGGEGEEKAGSRRILTRERLEALLALLQRYPATEINARYGVDVERARLLGAGTMVLMGAMDRVGVEALRVSRRGIREGALLAFAHAGARWLAVADAGTGW
ncbi:MAG TPA: hypothetical protein VKT52_07425 [Ktedonobacterales bacterium]|nr:hypothetical protein [Ktedonobacterales bacterium]